MSTSNNSQVEMEHASPGSLACFLRPALQGGRVVSSSRMPTMGPVPLKPAIAAFRSLNEAAESFLKMACPTHPPTHMLKIQSSRASCPVSHLRHTCC